MKVFKSRRPQPASSRQRPMTQLPVLHRMAASSAAPAPARILPARRYPSPAAALYTVALVIAVFGIIRVIVDFSVAALGYLAGLTGIFMAIAAGLQQMDQRREERRQARLQEAHESLRLFDTRFEAVTSGIASANPGTRAASGAALMSFLRAENSAFHEQTYYFLLAHLKSDAPGSSYDHAALRAFERAARLVLPVLADGDADSGGHVHGERRLAVDLSGAQLPGASLAGLELSAASLTETSLTRGDLSGACLWRASGDHTDLASASLRCANLEEAQFFSLFAPDADFTGANLTAARFGGRHNKFNSHATAGHGSVLRHAQFVRARLQGACLNGADLRDARFDGANLKGTSFRGAKLNPAAKRSILRSVSESWRKAHWDPDVQSELNRLAATMPRVSPARKPVAVPAPNYRRHPFPGHADHVRRLRISPAPSEARIRQHGLGRSALHAARGAR